VESAAEKFVRESLAAETLEKTVESPEDVVAALEDEVARLAAREAGPGAGGGVHVRAHIKTRCPLSRSTRSRHRCTIGMLT
jgi:hypothetical protein